MSTFFPWLRTLFLPGLCRGLIVSLWIITVSVSAGEPGRLRLAIACKADGGIAPEIQDRITTAISRDPQVEVLERTRIDLLLAEGETVQNPEARIQLGKFLPLDYFLSFRQGGEGTVAWNIEMVNAQSGELEFGCSAAIPPQSDPVEALTSNALRLIRQILNENPGELKKSKGATRVAVLDFVPQERKIVQETGLAMRLSGDVRTFLSGGGVTILDRTLAQQVVREHSYHQEGLVEDQPGQMPLLGADFVVTGKLLQSGNERHLEMTLLDTRDGRLAAMKRFVYDPAQEGGSLPEAARKWLVETLHPARGAERTFDESIQIEALEPFYQGIAKYFSGRYLEATADFQTAYTFNDKFGDAMLWEARCFDALGLKPLAEAERRFVKIGLVGRGVSSSGKPCAEEAMTFLGVAGASGLDERVVAETVEMFAIDRLVRDQARLQLASHLAPIRDEYDVLAGTANARGTRWAQAPSFLTSRSVRGEMRLPDAHGERHVTWFLVDNLSGNTLSKRTGSLSKNTALWRKEIEAEISALLESTNETAPISQIFSESMPSVEELQKQLSSKNGISANLSILSLALLDPGNSLLAGHTLSKGAAGARELDAFLNFALRDYLLAKMPAENPNRPWLELQRLCTFLPYDQTGFYLSGERPDARAALANFAEIHRDDLTGCVAQYMILYDQLSDIPPDTLVQRLGQLETRIGSFEKKDVDGLQAMQRMTRALRITAEVATGKADSQKLPTDIWAQRIRVEFQRNGKPCIRDNWVWGWYTMCWKNIEAAAANPVEEARASLAVLGQGDNLRRIKPHWLRDYPTSCGMMFYVIESIHQLNWFLGKPFIHPFDAVAEREHFRAMVSYAHQNLLRQLDLAPNTHDAAYLEDWVDQFLQYLAEPAFISTVTDEEWEVMRGELVKHVDSAYARVGAASRFVSSRFASDWRIMSRRPPKNDAPDREIVLNRERPDRLKMIQDERNAGDAAWRNAPANDKTWTNLVHSWRFTKHFSSKEQADIYLRYLPLLKTLYPTPELSTSELSLFYDFGMTLLRGGKIAEAEPIFSRMLEAESNDLNSSERAAELRANAALDLAWICRASGRKSEALERARCALDTSIRCGKLLHILQRINPAQFQVNVSDKPNETGNNLRAVALRLISELRNRSEDAPLPGHVKTVTVRTPSLENAELTFYYRVPEKHDSSKPSPVLIVSPSQSEGALDYCMDGNPWAQFADAQGIVLIVPQFIPAYTGSDLPALAGYQQANIWSGQATLDALEKIRALYNIDTRRLLLHGYGGGSQFVQHFARWAPERCVALSVHSAQNWLWKEGDPVAPLARLKNVPCFVTTGEEDNFACDEWNRLATAIQWVTIARDAGVSVLWKAWPGMAHNRAPEMPKMCISFFAHYLHRGVEQPAFVGDLRTSAYYSAGDARIDKIPKNFRQELPSSELAEMWGTPKK